MERYSKIFGKNEREIVLLKSLPCSYGKCAFCNYILDNSINETEINLINSEVLREVTGELSVLEVINSASVFELPKETLENIKITADKKQIKVLYFEVFYSFINRLDEIRNFFPNQEIRFKVGIETFDDNYRINVFKKNFKITNLELLNNFYSCCLLFCTQGQTKDQILKDIDTALKFFKEITINIFIENDTEVKRDEELLKWFLNDIYPKLKEHSNIEILVDNKDFGVYVQ